jgi:hypothetical protein
MAHRLEHRQNVLYRMFNADDVLLYVGITTNLEDRLADHRIFKGWWRDVVTIRLEHFGTRSEAEAAEILAIDTEHPLWNVRHGSRLPARTAPLKKPGGQMQHRNFRIEDDAWLALSRISELRGERPSDVMRDLVKGHVAKHRKLIADDPVLAQRIADLRAQRERKQSESPAVADQQERQT